MKNVRTRQSKGEPFGSYEVKVVTKDGEFVVAKCWDPLFANNIEKAISDYVELHKTNPISREEWEERDNSSIDESRKVTLTLKQLKRLVNESEQKDWFGIKGARYIWHGEWSDPEIIYKGFSLNYWDVMEGPHNVYCEEHPEDEKETGFDEWLKDYGMEGELENLVYCQLGDNGLSRKPWLGIKDAYLVKELNGKPVEGKVYYKDCLVDLDDFEYYDEEYEEMLPYSDSPKSFERYYKKHPEHKDEVIDELDRAVSEYI